MNDGKLLEIDGESLKNINQNNYKDLCKKIINDETIISINGEEIYTEWTPENHKFMNDEIKECIWTFLLVLKKYQKIYGIKIPKYVIFEILKKLKI
jgi:hypothetical protein